ncbi:MAG: hypothetical protein LW808_003555 [Verrucomicrobiota bacterium]|nr:MAG: hypothetical protein LW808_003555 [Verrucomicrobiota bacterium]
MGNGINDFDVIGKAINYFGSKEWGIKKNKMKADAKAIGEAIKNSEAGKAFKAIGGAIKDGVKNLSLDIADSSKVTKGKLDKFGKTAKKAVEQSNFAAASKFKSAFGPMQVINKYTPIREERQYGNQKIGSCKMNVIVGFQDKKGNEISTDQFLDELNEARKAVGMKPLKGFESVHFTHKAIYR